MCACVFQDVLQNTELEVTLCLSSEAKSLTVLVNKVVKIPSKDATGQPAKFTL